jgi:protease IV
MSLDTDAVVDRRRMRRKLTFWRVATVVAIIVAVGFVTARLTVPDGTGMTGTVGPYIARVKIQGLIRNDDDRTEALERLARSNARAVIVRIDSPGGTVAGSEQLHASLRRVAAQKPTVVVIDGLAASGGYIAAMAGEHIIARDASLVGSIGVLFQYPEVYRLLDQVGVKVEAIRSAPLKAAPNGFEPTSPEARAAIESIVQDSFDWFKGMVRERRQLDDAQLATVSDGRVFTGRQAMPLKLVDRLGDEQTALEWLEKEKGIDSSTRVTDWKLQRRFGDLPFIHLAVAGTLDAAGLGGLARRIESSAVIRTIERLNLDGLLALWHPASDN